MTAESTHYALQLSVIEGPPTTVSIQIIFEAGAGSSSQRVEVFPASTLPVHANADPMSTRTGSNVGVGDQQTRIFRQIIGAEYAVELLPAARSFQQIVDLLAIHTPKSNTTFRSRSISMMFWNSA